jgi:Flp pilus assembly protein TadB
MRTVTRRVRAMSADSTVVGYVVGGIPVFIGGMGLLRGMEFLGLPPVVAGVGVVATAFGVAETLGALVTRVGRAGQTYANATNNPTGHPF